MNDELKFRNLLDSLTPAALSALIDLADGDWLAVFEWPKIVYALEDRGLVKYDRNNPSPRLTDLGILFVSWYRSRDLNLPVQERLF